MNKTETLRIMASLRVAYPDYYKNQSRDMAEAAVNLWLDMLKSYDYTTVNMAIRALISTQKFAPKISEVIEKIRELTSPPELGEGQAWSLVQKAVSQSGYRYREEFERLPPDVQAAVGAPEILHQWALLDTGDLETVIHSNFNRAYRARVQKRREWNALPEDVQQFARSLSETLPQIPQLSGTDLPSGR